MLWKNNDSLCYSNVRKPDNEIIFQQVARELLEVIGLSKYHWNVMLMQKQDNNALRFDYTPVLVFLWTADHSRFPSVEQIAMVPRDNPSRDAGCPLLQ